MAMRVAKAPERGRRAARLRPRVCWGPSSWSRGVAALSCLVLVASARPGAAAERELEDEPAPASANEIETPLDRIFPVRRRKTPLFPYLRQRIQRWHPFFSESVVEGRFRTYYLRQDTTTDSTREAWAIGGSLYYHSGWFEDAAALEVEGFTSQPAHAPDSRDGTLLLEPGQNGYSVLGIANAKLRYKGLVLTGFRQYLDLPYVNRRDNRMTPNTFESITLAKPAGAIRFSTGYTWRIKARSSDRFRSMTGDVGFTEDRGLAHGGAIWEPNERFTVGFLAGGVPDLSVGVYSESSLKHVFATGLEARLDGQFSYQWETGDDLLGDLLEDNWSVGLRGSASYAGVVGRLGVSVTGPHSSIQNLYGSSPSYVDLMQSTFTRADEKALLVSLSYDLSGLGLPEVSTILNLVAAWDGEIRDRHRNSQELNATIDYRLQRGELRNLWFRARVSWLHEEGSPEDGTNFRLILRYDFPIL